MNVALHQRWTTERFLAWEERQELRYEFDGFQPIAMAGGTAAHAAIERNLLYALTGGLRGKRCQPYGSDLKIKVADGQIRYPQALEGGRDIRLRPARAARHRDSRAHRPD